MPYPDITDLRAISHHRGGYLSVEKRLGNRPGVGGKEIEVLPAGMDNLFHVRIADNVPERLQGR